MPHEPEAREASVPADVRIADAGHDAPGRAAQRGNAPDRTLSIPWRGRREIQERVAVRRPARRLVVDRILRDRDRRSPGKQTHQYLPPAVDIRREGHGPPVR